MLKRPWKTAGLDAQTVRAALGDKAGQVQSALTLSDQIGPILASGTQGNPRQIKRFLNTLLLRHQTASSCSPATSMAQRKPLPARVASTRSTPA